MSLFLNTTWDSSFSVGNATLDRQHKLLLTYVHCIMLAASHQNSSSVHTHLNMLLEYAKSHFGTEEALLEEARYQHLPSQQASHHAFNEHVLRWSRKAVLTTTELDEISKFVEHWWLEHILVEDMQYKQSLIDAGLQ